MLNRSFKCVFQGIDRQANGVMRGIVAFDASQPVTPLTASLKPVDALFVDRIVLEHEQRVEEIA